MECIRKNYSSYLKRLQESRFDEADSGLKVDAGSTLGVSAALKALDGFNPSALGKYLGDALSDYKKVFSGKGMIKVTQISKADRIEKLCKALGEVVSLLESSLLGLKNGELDGSFLGDTLADNQKALLKAVDNFKKAASKI